MKLSSFKYEISPDLIAQRPLENRDDSRLMVVHKDTGKIEHKTVSYTHLTLPTIYSV